MRRRPAGREVLEVKSWMLKFLKVAERPTPPPGAGESFELFNPSKRLLWLHWIRWLLRQISALVGVVFSLAFLGALDIPEVLQGFEQVSERVREEMELDQPVEFEIAGVTIGSEEIAWVELITWLEKLAILVFLVQFLVSGFLVKLRWEMHWYMVSDRILGIRKGLMKVSEQTMTIANVQNMKIRQGPLQRVFGISDLEVQTAGGSGSSATDGSSGNKQLHVGLFEGLDDAESLRETIRRTLAQTRSSGLGDPDDHDEVSLFQAPSALLPESSELPGSDIEGPNFEREGAPRTGTESSFRDEARAFKNEVIRARVAAESLLERFRV